MKNTLFFIAKVSVFISLNFSSFVAFSEYPSVAPATERRRIDFLSTPDWIEINKIEKIPEKIVINVVNYDGAPIPVATFSQDGSAFPELVSIFKEKIKDDRVLFAIVKWRYYLSGVNTEGDYYEVHAYQSQKNENGKFTFTENKKTSDFFGSGFDGKQAGKSVHFIFKDAASIRKKLNGR